MGQRTKAEEKRPKELSGVGNAESCRKRERPPTVKRDEGEPAKRSQGLKRERDRTETRGDQHRREGPR